MSHFSYYQRILGETVTYSNLETELGTASNLVEFIQMINTPHLIRQIAERSAALTIISSSATAKALLFASTVAMATIASSVQASINIFNNTTLARAILLDKSLYGHYRNNKTNYEILKSITNISATKLKKVIFLADGTLVKPSLGFNLINAFLVGWGGEGSGTDESFVSGGGGQVTNTLFTSPANSNLSIVLNYAANSSVTDGVGTASATKGSNSTGGGSDSGNGISAMTDRDFLGSPWQCNAFSAKGEDGHPYGTTEKGPYVGSRAGGIFDQYGRGIRPDGVGDYDSTGRGGIAVINYLEN